MDLQSNEKPQDPVVRLETNLAKLKRDVERLRELNVDIAVRRDNLAVVERLGMLTAKVRATHEFAIAHQIAERDAIRERNIISLEILRISDMLAKGVAKGGGIQGMLIVASASGLYSAWRSAVADAESIGDGNAVPAEEKPAGEDPPPKLAPWGHCV